ncbi:hypothetical protein OS493_024016 [Desmophyllum pertusum]|uniref:Uncharacterized protein n=1 Tax=Desmophyllum pertusum TaxID=174260 RepID=A0A9W9ZMB8_9CNID|nr:hypothetical protein OS493_024016 [Desmophyllum pertusum]
MAAKISFYKELNKLSTADFYIENKKNRTQASKELFESERVISKRGQIGKEEYFYQMERIFEPREHMGARGKLKQSCFKVLSKPYAIC